MKSKKLIKILRIINITVASLIIVLSVVSFIFVVIDAITSLKFFLIFSPIFMTLFGLAMLAAEFKVEFVLERLPFLGSLIGKAIFNIYLSSIIYYFFEASNSTALAWIGALSLFITGIFYLCVYLGCGSKLEKAEKKSAPQNDQNIQPSGRQPLM